MTATGIGAGALSMVLVAGLGLFGAEDGGAGAAQASEDRVQRGGSGATDTVTLITGDRVRMTETAQGTPRVDVRPGPGREGVGFTTKTIDGRLSVLPSDALELLGAGRLDPRLFDISLLSEAGYDDAEMDTLPLIVHGSGAARRALAESDTPGVTETTALPALGASAVRTDKRDVGGFWEELLGDKGTLDAGVQKVWLDGPVRATLDESVGQVGAPKAWDSGFTGKGVRVAVLDSGIDSDHPDLSDAVAARKDFSHSGSADDGAGHGTHVASIVAGDGAASDGRYTGVAPDAELLNGKVLNDSGFGMESDIIRGMEWAVDNDAAVVNMSLGGCATGATDPMTEAVDRLSESSETLFVIAAGNHGDGELPCRLDEAVSSPATADSALAVGSVDKSDELSDFSNIGPRTHDGAVKPEITAPGEEIHAARAAGSVGNDQYTTYSGTSMAAPHVAGAAAALAQQHPDWDGERLRDRLLATAKPNPALGVFEQGAGRLALDAAVSDSSVTASPSVLSAPRAKWPHDDDQPWSKTLTYRNSADEPVTLRLSTAGTGPDGEPAADGMFTLDRETLRVPANGSATATLTVDSSVDAPDGPYSGEVLAETVEGERVARTPVGLDKEPESYELELRLKNGAGNHVAGMVLLTDHANQDVAELQVPKQGSSIRLPAGRYDVMAPIADQGDGDRQTITLVTKPDQALDADRTVVLDAGAGEPVDVRVPSETAERVGLERLWAENEMMSLGLLGGAGSDDGNTRPTELRITPTEQLDEERYAFGWMGTLAEPTSGDGARAYGLYLTRPGGVPEKPRFDVKHRDLAEVRDLHYEQGVAGPRSGTMIATPSRANELGYELPYDVRTAGTQVQYLSASPGLRWVRTLETAHSSEYANVRNPAQYQPGKQYTERWNAAPLGLRLEPHFNHDQLWSPVMAFAPSGHTAFTKDTEGSTSSLVVRKDGKVVLSSDGPNGEPVALPAESARYDWRLQATRDVEWSDLGTETNARWTVDAGPDESGHLPVPQLWMTGELDRSGRAPATEPLELELTVRLYDNTVPEVRNLRMEVSFDDGESWRKVKVRQHGDGFAASIPKPPAGTTAVSTRVSLQTANAELEQTMIRAYGVDRTK